MEANQNPVSMQVLFTQVQQQLNQTLQCRDSHTARKAIGLAEKAMTRIEGLILADPMVNEDHIRRVVEYTRGPAWEQARRHAASLN